MTQRPLSPRSRAAGGSRTADAMGRKRTVRVTVDLEPHDYDMLRDWAHRERMSHSDVLRALVRLLAADDSVASAVRDFTPTR